jgi:hypothetical protein
MFLTKGEHQGSRAVRGSRRRAACPRLSVRLDVGVHLGMCGAVAMISPVLTLSLEALDEDGVLRHPSLVPHNVALVAGQEMHIMQKAWEQSRNILPSPEGHAPASACDNCG